MTKEILNQKLNEFKIAQHEARKQFKTALDQMYIEQRAKMANIRKEREAVIAEYKKTKLDAKTNIIANSEETLKNNTIQM